MRIADRIILATDLNFSVSFARIIPGLEGRRPASTADIGKTTTSWGDVLFLASSDPCDSDTWSDAVRPEWTTATSGETVAECKFLGSVLTSFWEALCNSCICMTTCKPKLLQQKKDTTEVVTEENRPDQELATRKYLYLLLTWKPEPYRTKDGDSLLTCMGVGDCNELDPDVAACFKPVLLSVSLDSDIH